MTVWLVQYRYEKHRSLERRLAPGIVERWRIAPYGPARISQEANEDDLVVIGEQSTKASRNIGRQTAVASLAGDDFGWNADCSHSLRYISKSPTHFPRLPSRVRRSSQPCVLAQELQTIGRGRERF